MDTRFDVIIVGTSFASSFFLHRYLATAPQTARILVLERGDFYEHRWRIKNRQHTKTTLEETYINKTPHKDWVYSVCFGGTSNAWWACTPRFLPNDFRMKSQYGVGVDWPISYDQLSPYYDEAEKLMFVAGDGAPYPRATPYPQPAHNLTDPDKVLQRAYPDLYFPQPTARPRLATQNRPACCATGVCSLCPMDAKYTVQNEMQHLYDDPRITLELNAHVLTVETQAKVATGVRYQQAGKEKIAKADLVALGANAVFNPCILERSGLDHPLLGRRIDDQVSVMVRMDLEGLDNFQGSTSLTGNGYMLYDGEHRKDFSGCLMESANIPQLRAEYGRWRQRLYIKCIFENLPNDANRVRVNPENPLMAEISHANYDSYAQKGIDNLHRVAEKVFSPLPIEKMTILEPTKGEAHIVGSVVMGNDPKTSVVDKHLKHHQVRNLLVLGGSAFPTATPSNPSLTLSALSLWAAEHL